MLVGLAYPELSLTIVNSEGPTKHSKAGEHENTPNPDGLVLPKDIIPLGAKNHATTQTEIQMRNEKFTLR